MNEIREMVEIEGAPATFRFTMKGKLYAPDAAEIDAKLKKGIDKGARNIVLACHGLDQVDSAVLSTLIANLKYLRSKKGGAIIFVGLNATVSRILQLTKMDAHFPVVADEAEALKRIAA